MNFVQDLHRYIVCGLLLHSAGEAPSCVFATWHANHAAAFRHGTRPRNARRHSDLQHGRAPFAGSGKMNLMRMRSLNSTWCSPNLPV